MYGCVAYLNIINMHILMFSFCPQAKPNCILDAGDNRGEVMVAAVVRPSLVSCSHILIMLYEKISIKKIISEKLKWTNAAASFWVGKKMTPNDDDDYVSADDSDEIKEFYLKVHSL